MVAGVITPTVLSSLPLPSFGARKLTNANWTDEFGYSSNLLPPSSIWAILFRCEPAVLTNSQCQLRQQISIITNKFHDRDDSSLPSMNTIITKPHYNKPRQRIPTKTSYRNDLNVLISVPPEQNPLNPDTKKPRYNE